MLYELVYQPKLPHRNCVALNVSFESTCLQPKLADGSAQSTNLTTTLGDAIVRCSICLPVDLHACTCLSLATLDLMQPSSNCVTCEASVSKSLSATCRAAFVWFCNELQLALWS